MARTTCRGGTAKGKVLAAVAQQKLMITSIQTKQLKEGGGDERTRSLEGVPVRKVTQLFEYISLVGGQIFQRNNVINLSATDVHAKAGLSLISWDLCRVYLFFTANPWSDWVHAHPCLLKRRFGWKQWHFLVKCFIISGQKPVVLPIGDDDLTDVHLQLFEIASEDKWNRTNSSFQRLPWSLDGSRKHSWISASGFNSRPT